MKVDVSVSSELLGSHIANTGVFKRTMDFIANLHGGDGAIISSHGTTFSIQVVILYLRLKHGPGIKVLVPSNSHISLINAATLFQLRLRFIPVGFVEDFEAVVPPSPENVLKTLEGNPDAKAVFIVSPTYDGLYANISQIAKICSQKGIPLIVDAAWSHLPDNPLQEGVVMFLKSTHKMEGSDQGGAIIVYKKSEMLDETLVWKAYRRLVSTSPPFTIMMSVNQVYRKLRENPRLLEEPAQWAEKVRKKLEDSGLAVLSEKNVKEYIPHTVTNVESWKLQIALPTDVNGLTLKRALEANDIVCEKAGIRHIQIIASWRVIKRLKPTEFTKKFLSTIQKVRGSFKAHVNRPWPTIPFLHTKKIKREVFETDDLAKEFVPISRAANKVSAEALAIYPPCSPIIVPGVEISESDVRYLQYALEYDLEMYCARRGFVEVLLNER